MLNTRYTKMATSTKRDGDGMNEKLTVSSCQELFPAAPGVETRPGSRPHPQRPRSYRPWSAEKYCSEFNVILYMIEVMSTMVFF